MEFNPKKLFTPAEAKKMLPLVRQIVGDIINLGHEIRSLLTMLGNEAEDHPQVEALLEKLRNYFLELENLGCYYKDWGFSIGLVDFPAKIDDKIVFLCWRSDEEDIRYYHEIESGYAGRTLIPERYFS